MTSWVELYVPPGGETDTVGRERIVYVAEVTWPVYPRLSLAKNLSVELALIIIPESGLGPFVLDVVGVEPSVV